MPITDQIKNYARKLTEDQPDVPTLRSFVRRRKPSAYHFSDDGIVPNHPRWPLLIYRGAVQINNKAFDPATVIDTLFDLNRWGRSWRDGVYDFVHYYSRVHEAMELRGASRRSSSVA